jgi:hypothetical protein
MTWSSDGGEVMVLLSEFVFCWIIFLSDLAYVIQSMQQ